MIFEWDEQKNTSNKTKHGVSFSRATTVFNDPFHILRFQRYDNEEERWNVIGGDKDAVILIVICTYRDVNRQEVTRIISARRATKQERNQYERKDR